MSASFRELLALFREGPNCGLRLRVEGGYRHAGRVEYAYFQLMQRLIAQIRAVRRRYEPCERIDLGHRE